MWSCTSVQILIHSQVHESSPVHKSIIVRTLLLKQIVPTNNMQPKSDDTYMHHCWLNVKKSKQANSTEIWQGPFVDGVYEVRQQQLTQTGTSRTIQVITVQTMDYNLSKCRMKVTYDVAARLSWSVLSLNIMQNFLLCRQLSIWKTSH